MSPAASSQEMIKSPKPGSYQDILYDATTFKPDIPTNWNEKLKPKEKLAAEKIRVELSEENLASLKEIYKSMTGFNIAETDKTKIIELLVYIDITEKKFETSKPKIERAPSEMPRSTYPPYWKINTNHVVELVVEKVKD